MKQDEIIEEVKISFSSDHAKRRFKAIFIRQGTSQNGNFYSSKILKEAVHLIKPTLKMYLDHINKPTIRDLVALVIGKSFFKDGAIMGEILILDNKILEQAKRNPESVGLSINAIGDVEFIDGMKVVRKIKKIKSIDFVEQASSGGSLVCPNCGITINNI